MNIIEKIKNNPIKYLIISIIILFVWNIYLTCKQNTIEKFTATSAPTSSPTSSPSGISQENLRAIDNLAQIAKILNSNGTVTIPGNLKINGEVIGPLKVNGNLDVSDNLKAKHINSGGVWIYSNNNNIPTDITGSQANRVILLNGDGTIKSSGSGFTAITNVGFGNKSNIHTGKFVEFYYVPNYTNSIIRFQFDGSYTVIGNGNDMYHLELYLDNQKKSTRYLKYHEYGGGGGRSGALLPISGTYNNTSKSRFKIHLQLNRDYGDDNIDFSNLSVMIMETQK